MKCQSTGTLLVAGLLFPSVSFAINVGDTDYETTHNRVRQQVDARERYHFTRQATYLYTDFLQGDDATTLGIETDAAFGFSDIHVRHIMYLEVADYPRVVPGKTTNPDVTEPDAFEEETGITDLLTGFWFSRDKEEHHALEIGYGLGLQLPTASDDSLGTGKWSAGPSIDIEYKKGNFFGGSIFIQLWDFAGESDRKSVNTLIWKYFLMYDLNPDWKLISIPYGVTYYWNKPSDEALSLPVGGGIQRNLHWGKQELSVHLQAFKYIVRPSKGSEADVRLTLEWYF